MVESGVSLHAVLLSPGNSQSYVPLKAQEAMTLLLIPAHVSRRHVSLSSRALLALLLSFLEKHILSLCSAGLHRSIIWAVTSFQLSLEFNDVTLY